MRPARLNHTALRFALQHADAWSDHEIMKRFVCFVLLSTLLPDQAHRHFSTWCRHTNQRSSEVAKHFSGKPTKPAECWSVHLRRCPCHLNSPALSLSHSSLHRSSSPSRMSLWTTASAATTAVTLITLSQVLQMPELSKMLPSQQV